MRRPQESVNSTCIFWGKWNRMKRAPSGQCVMSLPVKPRAKRCSFQANEAVLCGSLVSKVEESKTPGHFF